MFRRQRVRHAAGQGKLNDLKSAAHGAVPSSRTSGRFEQSHSLCPMEDSRAKGATRSARIKEIATRRGVHHVDNVAWVS